MSGPTGPTGITGPTGLQGLRGYRGPPIGPTGPPVGSSGIRLNIITPSSSPVNLYYSTFGSYYNITSNVTTDGNFILALPSTYNPTYTTNNQSTITTAVGNGTAITYTTGSTAHRLQVNSLVTITGVSGFAAANVSNATVATVPSSTTFTILSATSGSGTGGSFSNTIGTETDNELYLYPEQAGLSWFIRNNFYYSLTPTITGGTISYQGSDVSTLYLACGQGLTITYNGSNGFVAM